MKAVIYARVSSREQEETGYSLPAQQELLEKYAERQGLKVTRTFSVAESASGAKQRQTFAEMMAHMEKNGIKVLVCEKVDRLTRNFKDAVAIDEWIQKDPERQVHLVKDSLVLHMNSRSQEKLNWGVRVIFAKNYIDNLSEEVKKGQAEKIRQGGFPARSPLGYKTVGEKGRKSHVLDEVKAPFVRSAFERYATGNYSLAALRELLYEEGLRTRGGAKLSKSRLADTLGDPFYYGAMRWNDIVHSGLHEALVSREVWDKVQMVLRGKTTPHYKRHEFSFSKKIQCGECGGTISGEIKKGHIYYSCKHGKKCGQRGTIREEVLENQLMGAFKLFEQITPAEADRIYAKIRENHTAETEYKQNALSELQKRYNALQRQLDILYDDRLAEKISQERWEEKQLKINEERAQIQAEIDRLRSEETQYFELYINIIDLARRAREIYEKRTPAERRRLLSQIFSNLTLRDKIASYSLKKPLAVLAQRVQERLDAQHKLEPQKSVVKQRSNASNVSQTDSLLRG